jgi:prevent-host-death family protein
MKTSDQTKPISYLEANAAEMIKTINETGEEYIITENGEPKAVLMDIKSYEEAEAAAFQVILMMGEQEIREGKCVPAEGLAEKIMKEIAEEYGIQSNSYPASNKRSA